MRTSISPMSQHTELWDLLLWDAPMLPRVSRPPPLQRTRPPDPPSLWQHLYRTRYGLPLGPRGRRRHGTQVFHMPGLLLLLAPLLPPLLPPLTLLCQDAVSRWLPIPSPNPNQIGK